MAGFFDKLKDAAIKAGQKGAKDPRLMKAALNVKSTVDNFKQGYREQMEPEKHKSICPHCKKELPKGANFCPACGAKVE